MSELTIAEGLEYFKGKENAFIANVETGASATRAYEVGDYFWKGGKLYEATAPIASGTAFTVGTNCRLAVLGDDLKTVKDVSKSALELKTITDASIASFDDGADNIPVESLAVNIEPVQSGTGDPSPDNVRPITGWTSAKVTRAGSNLFDEEILVEKGGVRQEDGSIYFENLNIILSKTIIWENKSGYKGRVKFKTTRKTLNTSGGDGARIMWKYTDGTRTTVTMDNSTVFVDESSISDNGKIVSAILWDYGTATNSTWFKDTFVTFNLEQSYYEPYSDDTYDTYDIAFPSEAGTVYGGTLDVTNGVLTVTYIGLSLDGSEDWKWYQASNSVLLNNALYDRANFGTSNAILGACSHVATQVDGNLPTSLIAADSFTGATLQIKQIGTNFNVTPESLNGWKSYLGATPLQLTYKLAQPITYQLTPIEVATLLGYNNIWADTGDVSELIYYAKVDTTKQIRLAKALLAPVLDSMTADTALAVNDFRIVGNTLYRVTAPIASGGTLTIGTNVVATTIGAQITALLNA